jgi:hypothetical protein
MTSSFTAATSRTPSSTSRGIMSIAYSEDRRSSACTILRSGEVIDQREDAEAPATEKPPSVAASKHRHRQQRLSLRFSSSRTSKCGTRRSEIVTCRTLRRDAVLPVHCQPTARLSGPSEP